MGNLIKNILLIERRAQQYYRDIRDKIFHKYPSKNFKIRKLPIKNFYIFTYGPTGDIALISSLTQYLKIKYPKINIILITDKKYASLAEQNPDINKVIGMSFGKLSNYRDIESIASKYDYDAFLIATPHPNLRFLIPQIQIHKMAFLLMKDVPKNIPSPRLTPFKKRRDTNSFLLNLEAATFGWHKNIPSKEHLANLTLAIIRSNPKINFIVNQKDSLISNLPVPNCKIFRGDFKELILIAGSCKGIISLRSGLNDVVASMYNIPQLIIYPEGNFPNDNGIDCLQWAGLNEIFLDRHYNEIRINKQDPSYENYLYKQIDTFLKKHA